LTGKEANKTIPWDLVCRLTFVCYDPTANKWNLNLGSFIGRSLLEMVLGLFLEKLQKVRLVAEQVRDIR
jgi:hypothetical protein